MSLKDEFKNMITERKRWGDATQRICFQSQTYAGIT